MVKRELYLKKLRKLRDQNVIKIITGIRRSGKSTLFEQFQNELITSGVKKSQIIRLNLEEMENEALLERHVLNDYLMRIIDKNAKNYVFLDEIQNVPEYEKLVDSLYVKDYIDLYITGSNAYMLSSDIATLLSGRYIEISILPFSFSEFCENYENTPKTEMFADFMKYGGFPEVSNFLHSGAESEIPDYLTTIYKTVLEKDIKKRREIRSDFDFTNVLNFTMDNIGNSFSPNRVADYLTNQGNSVARLTVEGYLSALADSFVLYPVNRYDVKGKRLLQTLQKYYSVDVGLTRNLLGKNVNFDTGHLLENVVFMELLRRNLQVRVGKVDEKEVDFVVQDQNGHTVYCQVALSVRDEKTLERELAPFRKIRNHNEKILLTLDDEEQDFDGVKQINVIDWLLGK
jgi:predicted AAA+ superfamily ATPase